MEENKSDDLKINDSKQSYDELFFFIALANKRGAYELIESYNLYTNILKLKNNDDMDALTFLVNGILVANKKGAFEIEESHKIASYILENKLTQGKT